MSKAEARRAAQSEGEAAYERAEPRSANPYWGDKTKWGDAPLEVMHKAWNRGWDAAARAAERATSPGVVSSALQALGITHGDPPPMQTRGGLPRTATHWPEGVPLPAHYRPPAPREVPCPCCRRVRRDNGVSAVRNRKRSADRRWAYFQCEVCRERRCKQCGGAMFALEVRGGP